MGKRPWHRSVSPGPGGLVRRRFSAWRLGAWNKVKEGRDPEEKKGDGESIVGEVEAVVGLMMWRDLPGWQQHGSELIHTGYRKACGSVAECLGSWLYLHNETVNIHSHVFGALLFFGLPFWIFTTEIPPRYQVATTADIAVCSIYLVGVAVCFVFSAAFHTFMSHSEEAYLLGMTLDFQDILLLMWGATVPLIYYSFACHPAWQALYFGATSLLALLCSTVTFWPFFSGPHLGHTRAALFGSFGIVSFVMPIVHGMAFQGVEVQSQRVGLPWILATASFNGLGVTMYTLKFPEKWFARRFDLFGASHQMMHIMVLAAAMTYTVAVLSAFDFRHQREHDDAYCI